MIQPHAVPQNILDVEFKLFGSLTIKQFAYVAGSIMICLLCYAVFSANSLGIQLLRWITVGFFGLLGLMLAFYKVNERSFDTWLTNYIVALFRTQKSIYVKSQKQLDIFDAADDKIQKTSSSSKSAVSDYKAIVNGNTDIELTNKAKTDLDKREEDSLDRIDVLFANTFARNKNTNIEDNSTTVMKETVNQSVTNKASQNNSRTISGVSANSHTESFIQAPTPKQGFIQRFATKRNEKISNQPVIARDLINDQIKPQDIELLKRKLDTDSQVTSFITREEQVDPAIIIKLREQLAKRMQKSRNS